MAVIATALRHMLAAGMDADAIVAAVADMEANLPGDAQAERRRTKDRERKRLRNSAESADGDALPSPEGSSPTPPSPKPLPSIPPSPPKGGSSPADFADFWALYPNKVGKRDAEKAFAKARQRASLETILDGLRRYAAKTDDRPWCNPATWLNQDRWDDAPAAQPPRQAHSPPPKQTVGQQARDELRRMGMMPDVASNQTRYRDESDGSPGFAGTGIARRIALEAGR